ncbi:MAG: sulfite exporter TauE/SafE family protein [Beijerinckiaceae bacterium]|nr:sulfite exporter TauE/SafE family protein [Beijerinckiaceae bacterium]
MQLLPTGVAPPLALLLVAVSFFTSALTAAFGIGGGVAMLGALAGSVSPAIVVAVHGVVQLGSNAGRTIIQRRYAVWPVVARFAIGSIVGIALGAYVFTALPERVLLGVLGLFILAMVWLPKPRIPGLSTAGVLAGGAISSFLTLFVGATGPFVQSIFVALGFDRKQIIATHAVCMTIQHGLKVIAFGALGFSFREWLLLLIAMIGSGFLGTWLGTKLLERLPERLFQVLLKAILSIIALDLLRQALGWTFR